MKNKYDGVTITIPGFENYNGRKDIKKCSWLRLENAISTSEAMFGLDAAERYVFIEILCRASEKQNNRVKINVEYLAQRAGATAAQVCSSLSKLLTNGTLEVHDQIRSDTEGSRSDLALTNERTDERDERTDERDEVYSAPTESTALIESLKPYDLESKLQLAFIERKVPTKMQQALLDAYPNPKWVAQQIFKALAWEALNPIKRKKNFPRFLGNWFSRSWDDHTSRTPSNPQRGRSFQRPAGEHERTDDFGAMIEQVKTEAFTLSEASLGGMNAAVG